MNLLRGIAMGGCIKWGMAVWRISRMHLIAFALTVLVWPAFSYGQSSATAKVCGFLPIADLEAHFGAKMSAVSGSETSSVSMCGAQIPDRRHGADVMSQPPGPVSLTVEQRFAMMKKILERRGSQVKNFGSVGCFTDQLDIADKKLPTATCFLDEGGYLSLQLRSDDPKHLGFEAVKQLLEKTAARRK